MKKSLLKLFTLLAVLLWLPVEMQAADDEPGYYFRVGGCTYGIVNTTEVILTSCHVSGSPTEFSVPETVVHPTTNKVFTVAHVSFTNRQFLSTWTSDVTSGALNTAGTNNTSIGLGSPSSMDGPFTPIIKSLTTIHLPKTIKTITNGDWNLRECTGNINIIMSSNSYNRIKVTVAEDNPYIKAVDDVLYTKDTKQLLLYPTCRETASYTVLSDVEVIACSAFMRRAISTTTRSYFDDLTQVILPKSVRTIKNYAFHRCQKLSDINIPTLADLQDAGDADGSGNITKGVTIGEYAISYTNALKSITLPNSITSIGKYGFTESGLESVEIPGSVKSIEESTFARCVSMKTATINSGTEIIRKNAFIGCTSMTSVSLPEGLKTIATQAFAACINLPSIKLPSTVTSVGDYTFAFNKEMNTINIPVNAKLGKGVFFSCQNLENITVDGGTRYQMDNDGGNLDKGVLYGNSNNVLGTKDELVFFIPKNNIGASNTTMIRQWIMPSHVKKLCAGSIGDSYIESLVLPSGLETIDELAFGKFLPYSVSRTAQKVKELTIPASVTSLHFSAFYQISAPSIAAMENDQYSQSYFEKIYFMGAPTITRSAAALQTNESGEFFTVAQYNLSYTHSADVLSFYVKNSNLNNSKFSDIKSRVKTFSSDIPIPRLTEEGKISSMSRDFDVDFSTTTGAKAYIATGYDETNKGIVMKEVKYVPSRTGTNKDQYYGVIVKQTAADAGTYRIGEQDYNSSSQRTTFIDGNNNNVAVSQNRLVGVVVNTHVQGTEGGVNTWGLSGGKWLRITNTGKLTPYDRAYLKPTAAENAKMLAAVGGSTSSNAKVNMIFVEDDETTGIKAIDNSELTHDAWYTVNGQRLNGKPAKKGIYVHNGRKEVIQ